MSNGPRLVPLVVAALIALAGGAAASAPPLADSRCPTGALVDPAFRDAALTKLEGLAVHAPGRPVDGAIRSDRSAGLRDGAGGSWFRIAAYQVNLGVIGALSTGPRALPLAADWLRWQARHIAPSGPLRGVVLDTWVRADTLEESTCPQGLAPEQCGEVDAFDSTAASTLLAADAYLRAGGDPGTIREPAMRQALEAAATALLALESPGGFTVAKPGHPVVFTMDQVEVAAGWRAWARVQRDAYAQPASAANSTAKAAVIETAIRERLVRRNAWLVSEGAGAPDRRVWYPDTVAQAWPLLWLPEHAAQPDAARAVWAAAIAHWQRDPVRGWSEVNVDPDGFWWPAVAVAALCTGDEPRAVRWVARARKRWLDPADPFARPFQVGDLLWLLWMAQPAGRG